MHQHSGHKYKKKTGVRFLKEMKLIKRKKKKHSKNGMKWINLEIQNTTSVN